MKKLLVLCGFVLLFNTCKDGVIEPNIPGSSDYVWVNDNLYNLSGYSISHLWAASEDFVLAAGNGGLWQYDGNKWTMNNDFHTYNVFGLDGVDKYNVWLVISGDYNGSDIYRYNGWSWSKFGHYQYAKAKGTTWLNNLWVKSLDNAYAVGSFEEKNGAYTVGIIMKYDGYQWKILDIPAMGLNFYGITGDNNNRIYVYGEKSERDTTTTPVTITNVASKIYLLEGDNALKEIYSSSSSSLYPMNVGGKTYFMGDNKLYTYIADQFYNTYDFSQSEYSLSAGVGRNTKDMILWGVKKSDGWGTKYLVHYNGSDMKPIFSSANIYALSLVGNSIFAVNVSSDNKLSIAHGRLAGSTANASISSAYVNNKPVNFLSKVIHSRVLKVDDTLLRK